MLHNFSGNKTRTLQDAHIIKCLRNKTYNVKKCLHNVKKHLSVHTWGTLKNINHHQPMECTFLRSQGSAKNRPWLLGGDLDPWHRYSPTWPSADRLSSWDRANHCKPHSKQHLLEVSSCKLSVTYMMLYSISCNIDILCNLYVTYVTHFMPSHVSLHWHFVQLVRHICYTFHAITCFATLTFCANKHCVQLH